MFLSALVIAGSLAAGYEELLAHSATGRHKQYGTSRRSKRIALDKDTYHLNRRTWLRHLIDTYIPFEVLKLR